MTCNNTCSVKWCVEPVYCNGYCKSHYCQQQNHGKILTKKDQRCFCKIENCSNKVFYKNMCKQHYTEKFGNYKTCSIKGCDKPLRCKSKKLCNKHYIRLYIHGNVNTNLKQTNKKVVCEFPGCNRPHCAKGYCNKHYQQQRRSLDKETFEILYLIRELTLEGHPKCKTNGCNNQRVRKGLCGKCFAKESKEHAIEHKGGRCQICGYNKCTAALEFHHKDPNKKELVGKDWIYVDWDRIKKELDNCLLICSNCHAKLHYKDEKDLSKHMKYTRAWKKKLLDIKGDQCKICGYAECNGVLCFHHKNMNEKVKGIGQLRGCALATIKDEIEKCIVTCRNCHAEIHHKKFELEKSINKEVANA